MAADIIVSISAQANPAMPPRGKWKNLGDVALEQGDFGLAKRCFSEAKEGEGDRATHVWGQICVMIYDRSNRS